MNAFSRLLKNQRFIFGFICFLVLVIPLGVAQSRGGCRSGCGGGGGGTTLTTFTTADFSGSGNCAMCHSGLRDSAGNDVSLDTHWRSTMMANAAKDPLWQAKIDSEVLRSPALQPVIEGKCSRCHTHMARVQAVTNGSPVAVLGDGFLNPSHYLNAAAMDGVSCTLCHQIQDSNLGQPESFTGNYVIDTSTVAPDRLIFGKFPNPMQGPMRMHVGYTPTQGNQTVDAGLCGACHTLYTPIVDARGNVLGEFPEQVTYLEWRHSGFGDGAGTDQTCQACHLPPAVGGVKISNRPMRLSARSPFELHYLVGGNTFMVNVLKGHITELGVTASTAQLDATLARLNTQLQNNTATLSVSSAQLANGVLTLTLNAQNKAGHKLPSGFPSRRAWIHLVVTNHNGGMVFESGKPQNDGCIMGNDTDPDPGTYEPHFDLITAADQVQIYEPIMLDSYGKVTYTLLRAASYAKDNRLLPAGFDKTTADPDIAVMGEAAQDSNFVGGSDQVSYQINVQGASMPLTITAKLLYQTVSCRFAADLGLDSTTLVQRFIGYYTSADKTPALLASILHTIP